MSKIPVIQVVDGDGYKIINKRDFDPSVHQVYTPKKVKGFKNLDPLPDSDEG